MMLKDRLLEPEVGRVDDERASDVEDDGRSRTGTVWTATTHAITAVIGSGVLALPWSVAQLGWIFGPLGLIIFALITYYTATLLSDCYRTPDPIKGKRNSTYIDVVRSCLGPRDVLLCGVVQYVMLWGTLVGYTVTTAMSMVAVDRSNCIHYSKEESPSCEKSGTKYIILFGLLEVVLSQFPNLEEITLISVIAAVMSFAYSLIGLYFCLAKFISNHSIKGTIFGPEVGFNGLTQADRVWHGFQALGNIAFAYTYATVLMEIQDTLKSHPPENKTMKKASQYGVGVTTVFYVLLGCIGYAAFGNDAPGNLLSGVPEPFWLVDIANLAVVIHLIGAYQVYAQPIFAKHEAWLCSTWPETPFFHRVYTVTLPFPRQSPSFSFTPCTLVLRTLYVVITTWISMMLPFFNAIVGFLGAVAFWPLTVYYPVTMYMAQAKIRKGQPKWIMLHGLSVAALFVSLAAAVGSVAEIVELLKTTTFFG